MADKFEDHCWQDIISDEIIDIYKPYRRDIFVGERPALLAIDLYNLAYRGGPKRLRRYRAHQGALCASARAATANLLHHQRNKERSATRLSARHQPAGRKDG